MKILITICARGGSKGIPGKNIKAIGNKPLIAYTIDIANRFKKKYSQTTIALSTDSEEIRKISSEYGLESEYLRPDFLAGDKVGKIDAINDVLFFYEKKYKTKYDYILDMDVTSPLRNLEDIENALAIIQDDLQAVNLFSVSDPDRNPYFNMVEKKADGYYSLVKNVDNTVLTRQSAPEVYSLNASFYIYRRCFFDLGYKGAITDKSLIYKIPHICFDLDHPIDFDFMTYLIDMGKLDFNL
ncbi:MAG: acylneuraminate cytidylyltransferase family protein [Prevotella sp.]|jgi:CMP-N-acetylneuraminic acid synthetase|nr:acylneuraminate cytidylyltransferase family protein [Prevotella sp.]